MLEKLNSVFLEEASDLLASLEDNLLSLEAEPDNIDLISAVFRVMHTIKGSAGMFGFDDISKFTHEIETAYDLVRSGKIKVSSRLIELTLKARDVINAMLEAADGEIPDDVRNAVESLKREFRSISGSADGSGGRKSGSGAGTEGGGKSGESVKSAKQGKSGKQGVKKTGDDEEEHINHFWIAFNPPQDFFRSGTRVILLINELAEMGRITVTSFTDSVPPLSEIDPEKCYMSWNIILSTKRSLQEVQDVFIFVDPSIVTIEPISFTIGDSRKIGEILVSHHSISAEAIEKVIKQQKKIGELLVENKVVPPQKVNAALAEQQHFKKLAEDQKIADDYKTKPISISQQSIRVNSEKLDQLIDLVGELVTFNARLSQYALEAKLPALVTLSEQSERLILSLRDTSMDMRMLPIGTMFSRFRRVVHDLASDLDKKIELVTEGAETELDKTVIEKLNDPLIHLIRNSADHGIESPDARKAAGKDVSGIIKLSASHAGAFVVVSVSDDGGGIEKKKVFEKAVSRGLIQASDVLSDSEIYNLIFQPGFSTSDKVTSVSGRGVGLDVVKKDITSLGGTVSIESEEGKGSSFILKIPLTLAIIEGMLVKVGDNVYVVPLTNIEECLEFNPEKDDEGKVCSHISARGQMLPYVDLRKWFEIEGEVPSYRQVVVVNDQDSKLGLVVDKVVGNHQTVIKPLGALYKNIQGLSGATLLGDGSVALILDVFKLSDVVKAGIK